MASVSRVFIFLCILIVYFTSFNCNARRTSSSSSHHSSSHSSSSSHPSHTSHVSSTHSHASSGSGHTYPSSSHLSGSSHHSSLATSHGHISSSMGHQFSSSGLSGSGHQSSLSSNSGAFSQHTSYPSSSGLSGTGHKSSYSSSSGTSSKLSLYPSTNGLSGTGHISSSSSISGTSLQHPLYPVNSGLSGSGHQSSSSSSFGSSQLSSYPLSTGLSGSGQQKHSLSTSVTSSKQSNYPSNIGLSGYKPQDDSSAKLGIFKFHGASGSIGNSSSKLPNSGHLYPSTNGLSGSKSKEGDLLSGSSVQTKPHQGFTPSYTSFSTQSKISSQFGSSGVSSTRPVHNYPSSEHLSGTGNKIGINNPTHQSNSNSKHHHIHHHNTVHHYHQNYKYDYHPPEVIYFTPTHGHYQMRSYPVYTRTPPSYVYEYKSSGSRYSNLLAGLALYNLGKTTVNPHLRNYNQNYKPLGNEICVFGVQYNNVNYEEMSVDCRTITYFIWEKEYGSISNKTSQTVVTNTTTVTTVNVTQIGLQQNILSNGTIAGVLQNQTNSLSNNTILPNGTLVTINASNTIPFASNILPVSDNFTILPNGTLVPNKYKLDASQLLTTQAYVSSPVMLPNGTLTIMPNNVNIIPAQPSLEQPNYMASNGTLIPKTTTSPVIINTTTVQVTSAMDVKYKGEPIQVTKDMDCYVKRITPYSKLRKSVPCGLLDTYSSQSLRKNIATRTKSNLGLTAVILSTCFYLYNI